MIDPTMPWYEIPEWWLCILGVPTLVFVGWQSWETRKAAKAGSESARAALLNAQAVITSERPWLAVRFIQEQSMRFEEQMAVNFFCEIKNEGKTPAILIDVVARVVFNANLVPLPDEPIYGVVKLLNQRMLVPGATYSISIRYRSVGENEGIVWRDGRPYQLDGKASANELDLLVGFGCVRYRDVFNESEEHYTRFCDHTTIGSSVYRVLYDKSSMPPSHEVLVNSPFSSWDSAPPKYTECT